MTFHLQFFLGGLMSYLRYLCLFADNGVPHTLTIWVAGIAYPLLIFFVFWVVFLVLLAFVLCLVCPNVANVSGLSILDLPLRISLMFIQFNEPKVSYKNTKKCYQIFLDIIIRFCNQIIIWYLLRFIIFVHY